MSTHQNVRLRMMALFVILALTAAACGGGGEDVATEIPTPVEVEAAEAATPAEEAAPVETTPAPTEPAPTPTEENKPEEATPTPVPATTTDPPAPTAEPLAEAPQEEEIADAGDAMEMGGEATYDSYTVITDDAGTIEVEVPTEWDQIDGRPFTDAAGNQLFDVRTAPDLDGFNETWNVPGIIITASSDVAQSANEITLLDELVDPLSAQCTYLGREPYDDGLYTGQVDVFDSCGGTETGYVVIGAVPTSRAFVIRVQVQVTAERDLEALGRAIETFRVIGSV